MRNLHAAARHLADADRLGDGFFERGALVAHVGGVHAALVAGDARELDDLPRLGIGAWHVLQAGRETHGAVRHSAPDERLHPVELGNRRVAVRGPHHVTTHRVVPDERREVHRRADLFDRGQRLPDIERRRSAVSGHDGRDTHADEVLAPRLVDEVVGVGVDVDETRCDDEAGSVDHLPRVDLRDGADRRDAPGFDGDIRPPGRSAGAVDDLTASDQQVISRLALAGRALAEQTRTDRKTMKWGRLSTSANNSMDLPASPRHCRSKQVRHAHRAFRR